MPPNSFALASLVYLTALHFTKDFLVIGVRKALETCDFWLPQKILCPFLVLLQLYKVKVTSFMFPFEPPPKESENMWLEMF